MKNLIFSVRMLSGVMASPQPIDYLPAKACNNEILSYIKFSFSYNETHKQADWLIYELTKAEAKMSRARCDCFANDPSNKISSASTSAYTSTGFDQGHLSPAADYNMSDLVPSGDLNRYIVPVNAAETLTRLDYFPALSSSIENRRESQYEPGSWGCKMLLQNILK